MAKELKSFDLNGVLDNCQDWVDNIVPEDTPFFNKLERIGGTSNSFKWVQDINDSLEDNIVTGSAEGGVTPGTASQDGTKSDQTERLNYAQIFRKFVTVTDTAAATSVHGRKSETEYQLEKAVISIKNQIESTFLSKQEKVKASATENALTDGILAQIPAELVIEGAFDATNFETLTHNLFLNGSTADCIITNSKGAAAIKALKDAGTGVGENLVIRKEVEKGDEDFLIDCFSVSDVNGHPYEVKVSRHMEKAFPDAAAAYLLNTKDFTCVVFRDIKIIRLSKVGSTSRYLVECEYGLRHGGRYKAGAIVAPKL